MFRGLIYFTGFATLSASAAFALVVAHESFLPEYKAESPVIEARLQVRANPVPVVPATYVPAKAVLKTPTRLAPVMTEELPTIPAPDYVKNNAKTALPTSLRPPVRSYQAFVKATIDQAAPLAVAKTAPAKSVPVRTASVSAFSGAEIASPDTASGITAALAGVTFSESSQNRSSGGQDRAAPVSQYRPVQIPNAYVARSTPAIPQTTGQRLANNWNVGVYR